jgi:hypothetical protein
MKSSRELEQVHVRKTNANRCAGRPANNQDTFEADPTQLVTIQPNDVDVARIRSDLGLTQAAFGAATGIPHRLIAD